MALKIYFHRIDFATIHSINGGPWDCFILTLFFARIIFSHNYSILTPTHIGNQTAPKWYYVDVAVQIEMQVMQPKRGGELGF